MLLGLRAAIIALLLLPSIPFQLAAHRLTGSNFWYRCFLIATAWIVGMRVRHEGKPLRRNVLIAANHTSWLDIVLLGAATGGAFVSKEEVARWPVIGTLARVARTIFVARGERGAVRAQADQVGTVLATGQPVILFPEGTTGGEGRLLPFRASLFAAAAGRTDIVVQPVAVDYGAALARVRWPREESAGRNARRILEQGRIMPVTLYFLPPINPAGLDRKSLAAAVEQAITAALDGHRSTTA